jgi:Tfp pilus assembly protein PilN
MKPLDLRKTLAVGTGVGLEIGEQDLRVVMVRVRPSGVNVLGRTTIPRFRERPAGEWGVEYAEFLKRLSGSHLTATVLLPRRELIVRQITLPGVADRDLPSAIPYQIDSLHPHGEDEVHYGWARLPNTKAILIGITRRAVIDRYAALFAEAGIKMASFTFSAALFYSALRLSAAPPADGFLAIAGSDGELEIYGESPTRPVFSALFDSLEDRTSSLAAAELRLAPDTEPVALAQLLPVPKSAPADFEITREALAYAAALVGACPWLSLKANLLPPETRSTSSRAMFVPTVALAVVLLLLVMGLAAQATLQDRRHLAALEAEIARLQPQAAKVAEIERSTELTRARTRLLDAFRRRTRSDLDALNELTQLLEPPAWLNALELTRNSATLAGEAEQAAALLKLLDGSPFFRNSQFVVPIARAGSSETFRIRTRREEVAQ